MAIEKFRKRPVTLNMQLWDGTPATLAAIQAWVNEDDFCIRDGDVAEVWNSKEEDWIACPVGHWVVEGLLGEYYPIAPDALDKLYVRQLADPLTDVDSGHSDDRINVDGGLCEDLTFRAVSEVNRQRCERWHPGFPHDGWTGADWSNAMAGEAGETCNVVKKLRRDDFGKVQAAEEGRAELLAKLATEIGDTFMYLDLLAQFYGLNLAQCVVDTFNRVSRREGFPERIAE